MNTFKYDRNSFENFMKREKITAFADNFKMIVVAVLILSVIYFTIVGDATTKKYIWDWVVFMVALVLTSVILDIINHFKIKKAGL